MLYILHQVNCCGAFGAGFAKYIATKHPEVKRDYQAFVKKHTKKELLGLYHISIIKEKEIAIVHLFGQLDYGRDKVQTSYNALEKAICMFRLDYPLVYAICPKYMGCGNAGGDWSVVSEMIYKYNIIPNTDINI